MQSTAGRPRLFGTNGVRGVYGQDLTHELVIELCCSLASYFGRGPIVVGNDGRKSSPLLSKIVRASLNSAGLDVGNAGLVPTPCLQYAAKRLGYNGGIMITASHNPPQYNGLKPTAADGVEIPREDELKVEEIYYSRKFPAMDGAGADFADETVVASYMEAVLALVDAEKIRSRKFTVVMDTGNGAQAVVAPELAQKLGCKVIVVNGHVDGDFPGRGSEPTPDNLGLLSDTVKASGADFGMAYDGDGDRSMFCDSSGTIHWGDKTGALLVGHLLKEKHKGAEIVCPINTTMVLSMVAEKAGSKVIHTKVGSVEVSREMVRRGALLGLEENGGFMYGALNQVRDGAMATALLLDLLAGIGSSFSDLVSALPRMYQFKTKFVCRSRDVIEDAIKACVDHGSPKKVETLDGAKVWIDEETWVMVRPSGTEPLIRMYAESTDKSLLDSKVEEYRKLVQSRIT
jgi:phosphomannomutase/phosphoglucomutase